MADNTIISQTNDLESLCEQAKTMLKAYLQSVSQHFYQTWNKSTCSISVEFQKTKDDDITIKIIPKTVMPLDTEEFMGEYNDSGELRII